MRAAVKTLLTGFLMGSADVVPGVSGGTIALVAGIYERLISSVRSGSSALGSLVRGDREGLKTHLREVEWGFLLLLLAGILAAVLSLAHFIEVQLEERPVVLAAGFFGLVLGSIAIAFGLARHLIARHVAIALGVGAIAFYLFGFGSEEVVAEPSLLVFFASGALAICAMILPGISGSLILVMLGMYQAVLGAVNDRDYAAVGVFVIGAVIGLALFSQLLHIALSRWHDDVLAILIGLMIGSLRILWPWPDGVDGPALGAPEDQLLAALLASVIGAAAVMLVARLGRARAG